jgi:hypothetical protein
MNVVSRPIFGFEATLFFVTFSYFFYSSLYLIMKGMFNCSLSSSVPPHYSLEFRYFDGQKGNLALLLV